MTYVRCDDQEIEVRVERYIADFHQALEKSASTTAELWLSFYQIREPQQDTSRSSFRILRSFIAPSEAKLEWERWVVTVDLRAPDLDRHGCSSSPGGLPARGGGMRELALQKDMERLMTTIVREICEKRDHVPPLKSHAHALTFPFDITLHKGSPFGLDVLKHWTSQILDRTSPPPVLS